IPFPPGNALPCRIVPRSIRSIAASSTSAIFRAAARSSAWNASNPPQASGKSISLPMIGSSPKIDNPSGAGFQGLMIQALIQKEPQGLMIQALIQKEPQGLMIQAQIQKKAQGLMIRALI